MRVFQRLRDHDGERSALRRAGRAGIVVPAVVAIALELIGNPELTLFAAFGGIATLLLVDFSGPMRARLSAQVGLVLAGVVLICLGTLASRTIWAATAATFVIAFCVLFAGVVSSMLASATTALLVSFILPVTMPGSVGSIPERLGGWLLAGAASLPAISVLWPAPVREPLRLSAARACALQARRLHAEVGCVRTDFASASGTTLDASADDATAAVKALRASFFGTSYRPTGLTTAARALIRLIDQVVWLDAILRRTPLRPQPKSIALAVCDVKTQAATLLEHGAALLEEPAAVDPRLLDSDLVRLLQAREHMEHAVTSGLPKRLTRVPRGVSDDVVTEFAGSLEPGFRAQEMACAVSAIARHIGLVVAARRRSWWQQLLGHHPDGTRSPLSSAWEDLGAHAERHAVWLHNSVRGAAALGLAVLVAHLTGVQHSFWVVFGALAVLRSTALNTGQNAVRGLLGTSIGFLIGGGLIFALGTDTTVYWLLLPVAVACAGLAPDAVSFTVGQAGFTTALLILYNLNSPGGWEIGLVRVEDVAIGCAVSVLVGALFWPRGASSALGEALAEAFSCSARYLHSAIDSVLTRGDALVRPAPAPRDDRQRAASAASRLDDAFRGFLAERGTKQVPLAGVTALINAVVVVQLTADSVLWLWKGADRVPAEDHTAAGAEILHADEPLLEWYEKTARALEGKGAVPDPLDKPLAAGSLVEAVCRDLTAADGHGAATAVRTIWTADHIDVVRRLQALIVKPARAASEQCRPWSWLTGRPRSSGARRVEGDYGRT
ncbi:FUSC family protein [Streptomyces acidicola]|uniref:FUSC family protein n=1 Tax=Streptomyces acidicola TaxID=2596892 RepID=A0A5N8WN08_9ACTN|nr:FUSC family protein [Streptomyces acidicola]MPY47615.1 FUSC family protein [Streptomyces acidicola]